MTLVGADESEKRSLLARNVTVSRQVSNDISAS